MAEARDRETLAALVFARQRTALSAVAKDKFCCGQNDRLDQIVDTDHPLAKLGRAAIRACLPTRA